MEHDKKNLTPAALPQKTVVAASLEDILQPASEETGQILSIFAISVGTILTAFSATIFPPLGIAAVVLGTMLPLFWPKDKPLNVWASISNKISELIEEKLEEQAKSYAMARVQKLLDYCTDLKSALEEWLNSKTPQNAAIVRQYYFALIQAYMPEMRLLAPSIHKSVLLPLYVNAGLNYLSILRSIYPYADELALMTIQAAVTGKDHVLQRIQVDTTVLVNQAVDSYDAGLKKILERSKNPNATRQLTWVDYNEYRTTNTVAAMDFVAIYSYFYPEQYPGAILPRALNRQLFAVLDSYNIQAEDEITEIEEFEMSVNMYDPVEYLRKVGMGRGFHKQSNLIFDGLGTIECVVESVDGMHTKRSLEATGEQSLKIDAVSSMDEFDTVFALAGDYWSEDSRDGLYVRTLTTLGYYYKKERNTVPELDYFIFNSYAGVATSSFQKSIPSSQAGKVNPNDKERLVEIQMLPSFRPKFFFVFKWRHWSIKDDLLPEKSHIASLEANNPIEQFHAIRAATAIHLGKLSVIPGHGFTGGDLVEIGAGQAIAFILDRAANNPGNRWFAGTYNVRVWFYQTVVIRDIGVRIDSGPQFSPSLVQSIIPPGFRITDLDNAKYEDLQSFTFSGTVLIVPAMQAIELTFFNSSLAASIVLDRIELIFSRPATTLVGAI